MSDHAVGNPDVQTVSVDSLPLPTGASTAARQDTGNTALTSIDGKLPALSGGRVPVDGSGVTQPVSASDLDIRDLLDTSDLVGTVTKPQAEQVDEASATVTYQGWATVGTATSAASWRIRKISKSGNVTSITWADGNATYDNVWADRASLTYS